MDSVCPYKDGGSSKVILKSVTLTEQKKCGFLNNNAMNKQ